MGVRPFVRALVATDLSLALALALLYGGLQGDCAPPSIWCYAPGVGCFLVCSDAWSQFPVVLAIGILLGMLPGALMGATLLFLRTRRAAHEHVRHFVKSLPAGAVGIPFGGLNIILVFPGLGPIFVGLTMVLSFGLWVAVDASMIFFDKKGGRLRG
ncbi:MAG TPA: hypothetical protein VIL58_09325 [Thermoplasmata archaeon]